MPMNAICFNAFDDLDLLGPQIRTPAGGGDPAGVVVIQQREEVLLNMIGRETGGEFPRLNYLNFACCAVCDKWDIAAADTKIIELAGAERIELGACLADTFPHFVRSKNIHSHVLFCLPKSIFERLNHWKSVSLR